MASILPDFEYDIFISYRHNDNRSGWVTDFVKALQEELAATIKEPLSIYFDKNPHDGLLETNNVDKSLESKLKCLIFIPIISQTYCDPKSFAWAHEFCEFNKLAKESLYGRDIRLNNGNVSSRILPIRIHDIELRDKSMIETEIGSTLRAIDFIFKSPGVNRPLTLSDNPDKNQNSSYYRDQINKVANGIKEILAGLKSSSDIPLDDLRPPANDSTKEPSTKTSIKKIASVGAIAMGLIAVAWYLQMSFVDTLQLTNQQQEPIHKLLLPTSILLTALFIARMPARRMGYTLLQIAIIAMFAGGLFNWVVTLTSNQLPAVHLQYLNMKKEELPIHLVRMEFTLIRSLGSAMIAAAIGGWLLLELAVKDGSKKALVALVLMITLIEGDNSIALYSIGMLFYLYTALAVVIAWMGGIIWWKSQE